MNNKGQTLRNKGEGLHKQFSIDRAAANLGHARMSQNADGEYPIVSVDKDFTWHFQRFKRNLRGTNVTHMSPTFGSQSDKKTIYGGMTRPIEHASGKQKDLFETNMGRAISASQHIEYSDLRAFLLALGQAGFSEASDALLEEVIPE